MEISPLFYALGLLHVIVIGFGLWELKRINRVIDERKKADNEARDHSIAGEGG